MYNVTQTYTVWEKVDYINYFNINWWWIIPAVIVFTFLYAKYIMPFIMDMMARRL